MMNPYDPNDPENLRRPLTVSPTVTQPRIAAPGYDPNALLNPNQAQPGTQFYGNPNPDVNVGAISNYVPGAKYGRYIADEYQRGAASGPITGLALGARALTAAPIAVADDAMGLIAKGLNGPAQALKTFVTGDPSPISTAAKSAVPTVRPGPASVTIPTPAGYTPGNTVPNPLLPTSTAGTTLDTPPNASIINDANGRGSVNSVPGSIISALSPDSSRALSAARAAAVARGENIDQTGPAVSVIPDLVTGKNMASLKDSMLRDNITGALDDARRTGRYRDLPGIISGLASLNAPETQGQSARDVASIQAGAHIGAAGITAARSPADQALHLAQAQQALAQAGHATAQASHANAQAGLVNMDVKAKQQLAALTSQYITEPDPAKKQLLGRALLTLSGKDKPDQWHVYHSQGGTDAAGNKLPDTVGAVNTGTGEHQFFAGGPQASSIIGRPAIGQDGKPMAEGAQVKKDGKVVAVVKGGKLVEATHG